MRPVEELNIGRGFVLKNRSLLAAMTNKQSNEDGTVSRAEMDWLVRRAKGGFAITTTAAANVTEQGRGWSGEIGVWGDHQIPGLQEMATKLNRFDTISIVQLFHGGMRAPRELNGVQPISASVNTERGMAGEHTKAMTTPEIEGMIQSFTAAALRCQTAGFDGVELHGAHSYLISQFLGTKTNRRTDKWGGNLHARSRFLREIIKSIRAATKDKFLIVVRISPIIESAGINLEDSLQLAQLLCQTDIDMLHISCWDVFDNIDDGNPESLTRRFRNVMPANFPLISTGSVWDAKDAQWLMDEGADIVGVGRVAIAHPDWPKGLHDIDYQPTRPPFTEKHLRNVGLSPVFVDYMKRWKNFVAK